MSESDLLSRAVELARASRFAEAADVLERGLVTAPQNAEAWAMLGSVRNERGLSEKAVEAFDRAIALQPGRLASHVNRGAALGAMGRHAEAVEAYDRALAIDPKVAIAHNNRAQALNELGRHDEAVDSARRALALRPDYAAAHGNLGHAYYGLERYEDALAAHRAAEAVTPTAAALADVGMSLTALGRYHDASLALSTAVMRDPSSALARYRRAHARLTLRDFESGWQDYEHRWATSMFTRRSMGQVAPQLQSRLTLGPRRGDFIGQRVLVVAEQGVGDEIMFASMIPQIAAEARSLSLACDPRLARLFRESFPMIAVVGDEIPDPERFDHVIALGSLAHAYRTRRSDFNGAAYLRPSTGARTRWAERLGPRGGRKRVGISWRGGLKRTGAAGRSMALETLGPLLARENVEAVSLQYGDVGAEVAAVNARLQRPIRLFAPAEINDFDELAGLVANLDLVVTVQTAIVHLTGALGVPGRVMIPRKPEWRYGAEGEDLPWYRSIRLYRQAPGEAWDDVVARTSANI